MGNLGDKVEKAIEKVLPKKLIEKVKEKDCGCSKRKKWLNDNS